MVNTSKGGFIVRKNQLDKRGIVVPDNAAYKFPEPTVAIINTHKVGDYLFPDTGGIAPQDSSRVDDQGEPLYKKGDKPTWTTEGASVASFVTFAEFKAQLELEKLMQQA